MIGVKNNGAKEIVARYDGKDYTFPVGMPVAISREAAVHIFGLGQEDKTRALQRLGWMRNAEQYATAVARLDAVQFLSVEDKFNETADLPRSMMNDPDDDKISLQDGRQRTSKQGESKIDVQFPKAQQGGK